MATLPLNHYHHLDRLARLRRIGIIEAVRYLMNNVERNSDNWLDERFGTKEETRDIDFPNSATEELLERIQGLPRNIRPVTDGPYLEHFRFFHHNQGLIGIEAEGVKLMDFEMATSRDAGVYALVKDLLPKMTHEQYRIYNTFNSQYLRLVREPLLFTMPTKPGLAIDAGCYIGYKAFAMAKFNNSHPVMAFELASDSYDVLLMNIKNNPDFDIRPMKTALSDSRTELSIHTRNERTMAHSLTSFKSLKEGGTSLLNETPEESSEQIIPTTLLDDFTNDFPEIASLHISVNGHEPEVLEGGLETANKSELIRISCPYSRDGKPIRNIVIDTLNDNKIIVFGISGGAVIAGKNLSECHAVPL